MRQGFITAVLLLLGIATITAWLYVEIEYDGFHEFFQEFDRRFNAASELQAASRLDQLREEKIPEIQRALQQAHLDGWLFYNYQDSDPIANTILMLSPQQALRRRWFYLIPASGSPSRLVHRSEISTRDATGSGQRDYLYFDELPGDTNSYLSWQQMQSQLKEMLFGMDRIAMEYSPNNAIPSVSRVDAGTIEMVRRCGVDVVSSAQLIQLVAARWSDRQLLQHRRAAKLLYDLVQLAFVEVRAALQSDERMTEGRLQRFLVQQFDRTGLRSMGRPIVAYGVNSRNPNYLPPLDGGAEILPGNVLIVGVWGRVDTPHSPFAELTWMGYVGSSVPEDIEKCFEAAVSAREAALRLIQSGFGQGRQIRGWEVDEVARQTIRRLGFIEHLMHRTGHSLGLRRFGMGANLDGLESLDSRPLLAGTGLTIGPGIYLSEYGVRTEVNVFLHEKSAEVTTLPVQERVVAILR